MGRLHWFLAVPYMVLAIFLGIMIYVTHLAYNHPSGFTGQDMAQISKIRYQSRIQSNTKEKLPSQMDAP